MRAAAAVCVVAAIVLIARPLRADQLRADQLRADPLRADPSRAGAVPRADELVVVAPRAADSRQPLLGFLARPDLPGRLPAVVVLHGCDGFHPNMPLWAARLRLWGYVALAIDSLTPRHIRNGCEQHAGGVEEPVDALAALRYLAAQPYVDSARIAVVGMSRGGSAALADVEKVGPAEYFPLSFHAAIAYYPDCSGISDGFKAPVLILAGEKDDWLPAQACRDMARQVAGKGAPVSLVIYPGATHAFNIDAPPRTYLGHTLRYDPQAAQDAQQRERAFLHDTLGTSHPAADDGDVAVDRLIQN
jgi:dienelactone hydrolase